LKPGFTELEAGPAAWGWDEDQCWALTRIAEVVRRRFGVQYTPAGLDLHAAWDPVEPAGLGPAPVRIANHADAAGCRYALIAPPRPVAKLLRITGLNARMPVFATIDDALAHLTALASAPAEASRGLAATGRRSAPPTANPVSRPAA